MTLVCFFLDFIGFIVQLARFASFSGDERADVLLLITCYIFMIIDVYYACWVKSVTMNLPPKMREYSTVAIIGFGNKFKR